jgi:glycosyltransferase involved in cell wall biosynthesis
MRLGVNNSTIPSMVFNGHKTLNIASCSGIYNLKRLDLIIDSLAEVSENIKLNWIHFGSGSDLEITLDYAKKKLIKPNVRFKFKGQTANLDVLKYYEENQIDIFINTSDYEGIPVSIMEAMSYGIPCIARDIGGNSEIVVNQVSGWLIPKDASPTLIARTIEECYLTIKNDAQRYLELRFSTYNYCKHNFNAIINYNSFLNYILT